MNVIELQLQNFRNYAGLSLQFDPGVNLIAGENAQGKTNLLEAISYLSCGRSFRAQRSSELLRFGAEAAELHARVYSQEREQTLRMVLTQGRRLLYRNGAKKRSVGELAGVLSTVLFCPEDLLILKAGAAGRRRMADMAICQLRPNYDAALAEYNRILEQKSRILKDKEENPALLEVLPEFNERLVTVGATIIAYRARFFAGLGELAQGYHCQFSGGKEEFRLQYRTVSTVPNPFAPIGTLREQLREHLESHARAELESMQCLTGPHKDDFSVFLSDLDLKTYGSQGQIRTAAISLKLAQRDLQQRELGEMPVLLLDDVLSELDAGRQDFVLNQITAGQVFITCCKTDKITKSGRKFEISAGNVLLEQE